mmetsp:Transcript_4075/g.7027  ORF Transcript_4075/g.7027 Transcript_4075/m.7027 type:complete len:120 (+) Transcript_4075:279-638(+)
MDGDPENVVVDHKRIIFPKEEGDRRAILTRPTMRKWSPENHKKYFPKKFVDTTQSFLLCYRKLRKAHIVRFRLPFFWASLFAINQLTSLSSSSSTGIPVQQDKESNKRRRKCRPWSLSN